jgi:chaperonin GroES
MNHKTDRKMKELVPVNQNVILDLSQEKGEQKTAGGIIIPDTAKEKPKTAKVLAVSAIDDIEISVGDTVIYKEYSGNELELDGKKYLVIPYADILAKVVETESI